MARRRGCDWGSEVGHYVDCVTAAWADCGDYGVGHWTIAYVDVGVEGGGEGERGEVRERHVCGCIGCAGWWRVT